jgi:two-component system NtrC family sensor kinase
VNITTRAEGDSAVVEVVDDGGGIDAAVRDKIFDPFFTTKPPGEGTGLGLSISYGIIQDHKGTIRVVSEKGKGSTFTIHLPPNRQMKLA